ncbi:HupE/UreJ family protein [Nostoc sp. FACHB-110]|uniref:HupE/UreJ family protein n=1 Tax=Nostoc sp. FACHB-110 TaxID=2692834 RepID=UPI00168A38E0|nr:HupE/UreJ family protein [Nostoc sp. FACHB-110]MBD2438148.1 HupE/UreJ family protein [Nostoc sp. FACHB-110]
MLKDKLVHRHIGAIAALVLISWLSSWSVSPIHEISNSWDGLLWGIADPVLSWHKFLSMAVIGLLTAGIIRGNWIVILFVVTSILGTVTHLWQINFLSTEIAIAIASVIFGLMLLMPNRPKFLTLLILTAIAGLSQGYGSIESILEAAIIPSILYILGTSFTQYAVVMSCRKIGQKIDFSGMTKSISFISFIICTLSIVFLQLSFN